MGECFSLINLLMYLVYGLFDILIPGGSVSPIPPGVATYVTMALDYIAEGAVLLSQFVDLGYLLILFTVILEVDLTILAYRAVMWALKKIPMLNIK